MSDETSFGAALLGVEGIREHVRIRVRGLAEQKYIDAGIDDDRRLLEYLGADDEWHEAEGDPLDAAAVLRARDRSIEARRFHRAAHRALSTLLEEEVAALNADFELPDPLVVERPSNGLSIEDARKVARLVRAMIPEQPYRSLVIAGAAEMLRREWPHLDWEVRGNEIVPFEREASSAYPHFHDREWYRVRLNAHHSVEHIAEHLGVTPAEAWGKDCPVCAGVELREKITGRGDTLEDAYEDYNAQRGDAEK